ncbi:superoxide dismutase [Aureimonas jatrophae]|uniref:Superoxide dismutase n=1 Tax=Aureimonas jatrophae TaxID=1166073 RepID=A0A1H0C6C2_9HYPH|nr:superoxide dismutase [Aureimonas jatrophae]MBB3949088.1 Fe-Mn family superoxide dismutase [Aureimonas jatrophae]SDN53444.1 superoxide dismutase, Fe-Mn family [Aureimonas jatrophae]
MSSLRSAASLFAVALVMGLAPSMPAAAQQSAAQPTAQSQAEAKAPFALPELGYAYGALDPVIDAQTMELHHSKHHQAYVNNLNKAVEGDSALSGLTLEELVATAGQRSAAIRNNAGGHWNHSFFWRIMAPEGQRGEPSGELASAIESSFGSMDAFREAFNKAGADRFGSGWAWLIVDEGGKLAVTSTPNQDNPLMDVAETKGTPVLGNDVWEHAYYLKYNNRRPDYLKAWWEAVNWTQVSQNYAAALQR